jgi:uncharacterized protein (UPF0332 family)
MNDKLNFYINCGQIIKDNNTKVLAKKYLEKAKSNLLTAQILSEININKKARELLDVPKNYDSDEWVVITGYYAMYSASLALIAKIGYRSKNHSATILLLEEFFMKKKLISAEDLNLLKNAIIQKSEIEKLSDARHKREIAQYSVTKQTTKEIAESIKKDAYNFINKIQLILE